MNGISVAVYFHPNRDADLIALSTKIGHKAFIKVCKYSLKSLVEPEYGEKARRLCTNILDLPDSPCRQVRLSLTARQDEAIRKLINHLKPNTKGTFVKQIIRYTVGVSVILPLFLDDDLFNEVSLPVSYTAQFIISGNIKPARKRKYTKRKTTREIPKKITTYKDDEPENASYSPISYKENEVIAETNYNEPEDINENSTNDDADEILAMLNNMLG